MGLSRTERERFLAEPHVAALSVDGGPGRAPLSVPLWYWYEPGADVRIMTSGNSVKARRIDAAGRFTLLVDRMQPTVRYVSVEGPVVHTEPCDTERIRALMTRYLPADRVEDTVRLTLDRYAGLRLIYHMRPEHWLSADLGA